MFTDVAVLVHGYTLLASGYRSDKRGIGNREWDNVCLGDVERGAFGRIPHGVMVAKKYLARRLIFGTGATCVVSGRALTRQEWETQGKPDDVLWEAEVALGIAVREYAEWVEPGRSKRAGAPDGGRPRIADISTADVSSVDTRTEIANALSYCAGNSIGCLISVTNISHAARCSTIALNEIQERHYSDILHIVSPCDTDFADDDETLIFEPQSGGGAKDEPSPSAVLKRYFSLDRTRRSQFLFAAEGIFESLGGAGGPDDTGPG